MKLLEVVRGAATGKDVPRDCDGRGEEDPQDGRGRRRMRRVHRQPDARALLAPGDVSAGGGRDSGRGRPRARKIRHGDGSVPNERPGRTTTSAGASASGATSRSRTCVIHGSPTGCASKDASVRKPAPAGIAYESGRRDAIPDPAVDALIVAYRTEIGSTPRKIAADEIVDRCILALVNEGARILEEGIALRASDIDLRLPHRLRLPVVSWRSDALRRHAGAVQRRAPDAAVCGDSERRRRVLAAGAVVGESRGGGQDVQWMTVAPSPREAEERVSRRWRKFSLAPAKRGDGRGEGRIFSEHRIMTDAVIVSTARTRTCQIVARRLQHDPRRDAGRTRRPACDRTREARPGARRRRADGLRIARRRDRLECRAANRASRRMSGDGPRHDRQPLLLVRAADDRAGRATHPVGRRRRSSSPAASSRSRASRTSRTSTWRTRHGSTGTSRRSIDDAADRGNRRGALSTFRASARTNTACRASSAAAAAAAAAKVQRRDRSDHRRRWASPTRRPRDFSPRKSRSPQTKGIRADTTYDGVSKIQPALPNGVIAAGNASQFSDGAAACVVMSDGEAARRGLEPMGVFRGFAVRRLRARRNGHRPGVRRSEAAGKDGHKIDDIDLWEMNEAFAVQVIYCRDKLGIPERSIERRRRRDRGRPPLWRVGYAAHRPRADRRQAPRREECRRDDVHRRRDGRGGLFELV